GQRDDLAVIAELIHFAEALIEVEQLLDATQAHADILELRCGRGHLLEEAVREDMAKNIDDRVAHAHPSSGVLTMSRRCRGNACQPKRATTSPHRPFGAHSMTTIATTPSIIR